MKSVYIVLTQTGTLFSKAIYLYTKDPYNHASISFDKNLEIMYSFGRRRRYNPLDSGFIEENFTRGMFAFFPNTRCCIIEVKVTENEYKIMRETVEVFKNNGQNYRYNLMGVLSYSVGLELARKEHFFCSEFVSYILGKTSLWPFVPGLTKPMDFLKLSNKNIIFEGCITELQSNWRGRLTS